MKILAIDIGSYNIKSVIIDAKFKRFDIIFHDISPVSDAWESIDSNQILSAGQIQALEEIKNRYAQGIDRIVTNLPGGLYSSRFFTFPLKDKRKVQNAVNFAIEDEIPFNIDDCIITSHLYPTKTKETHVLTGYAQIKNIDDLIDSYTNIHLNVDAFMLEESALASQFLRAKGEKYKNCAVLNLGHRKSTVYFFRDNLPVLHRTTMTGGFHITEALSLKYSIGMAEAELAKQDKAFLPVEGMQLNTDQKIFAQTIEASLENVFSDFQQSMMAFTSRFNEPLDMIYLCGGTSLIPGLPEYLTQRWGKKVSHFQISNLYPQISIQPQKSIAVMLPMATALGISQVSGDSKSQINFRSGKLHATNKGLKLNFQQFAYPAKLALTVYLVGLFSIIGQLFFLHREQNKKEEQLNRALQNVIGRVSSSFLSSLKLSDVKLKQAINKELDKYSPQGSSDFSSIDFIYELSKSVSKTSAMEIKQLELSQNKLSLQIESPSQADAEKAMRELNISRLQNVKFSPLEATTKGGRKYSMNANIPRSAK